MRGQQSIRITLHITNYRLEDWLHWRAGGRRLTSPQDWATRRASRLGKGLLRVIGDIGDGMIDF